MFPAEHVGADCMAPVLPFRIRLLIKDVVSAAMINGAVGIINAMRGRHQVILRPLWVGRDGFPWRRRGQRSRDTQEIAAVHFTRPQGPVTIPAERPTGSGAD